MALTLNGSTYLSLADTAVNTPSASASLALWVKVSTDTGQVLVANNPDASAATDVPPMALVVGPSTGSFANELISFFLYKTSDSNAAVTAYETTTRTELFDGVWHHIAVTADGSTTRIYLDGVSKTVGTAGSLSQGKWTGDYNTAGQINGLMVGARKNRAGTAIGYTTGAIQDVRIYPRAISAAEVAALAKGLPSRPALGLHLDLYRSLRNGTGEVATLTGTEAYESGPRGHIIRRGQRQPQRGLARRMALEGLYVGSAL